MLESTSLAEKIGLAGVMGGTIVALVKSVKWIGNFSTEHTLLLDHLKEASPMLVRFVAMEEAQKAAKEERKEIIEEIRGLRGEIHDVLKLMVKGPQNGNGE